MVFIIIIKFQSYIIKTIGTSLIAMPHDLNWVRVKARLLEYENWVHAITERRHIGAAFSFLINSVALR